jgi:Domain of unknown function (DUF4124)
MMKKLLIVALLVAPAAEAAYRCKEEKGVTHIGFAPPPECANVVVYEVTTTGTVLRTIEPTLTGDQLKAKQEADARAKEAAKAAAEQRRKDAALLSTYGSEKDFERSRDATLAPIQKSIATYDLRIAAIEKRQKELADEMEFYKAGKSKTAGKSREAPQQLVADIEKLNKEKESIAASKARSEKEMEQVRARYEADKARWLELRQARK